MFTVPMPTAGEFVLGLGVATTKKLKLKVWFNNGLAARTSQTAVPLPLVMGTWNTPPTVPTPSPPTVVVVAVTGLNPTTVSEVTRDANVPVVGEVVAVGLLLLTD